MSDLEIIAYTAAALVLMPVAAFALFLVLMPVVGIPAYIYCWFKHPEWRPAAVEARTREAQDRMAAMLAGGRRRAFLRRRAERQAKLARAAARANPWLSA